MTKIVNGIEVELTVEEIEQVELEIQQAIAEKDANAWLESRISEYPSIEEQMDMMYWDNVNGTTVWKDTIEAIKEKYPKPE
jgi:hypothetical protein